MYRVTRCRVVTCRVAGCRVDRCRVAGCRIVRCRVGVSVNLTDDIVDFTGIIKAIVGVIGVIGVIGVMATVVRVIRGIVIVVVIGTVSLASSGGRFRDELSPSPLSPSASSSAPTRPTVSSSFNRNAGTLTSSGVTQIRASKPKTVLKGSAFLHSNVTVSFTKS